MYASWKPFFLLLFSQSCDEFTIKYLLSGTTIFVRVWWRSLVSLNKIKKKEERKKRKKYRIELADYRKAICLFAHPERIDESCSNGKWRERISRRVFESSNNADVSSISAPGGTIRLSRVSLEERFLEKVRMRTCKISVKVTVRVEYSKNLIIAIGSPISSKKNPIENIESSE